MSTSESTITEYERGVIDERERILALIRDTMLAWGHNGAKGCECCTTARMLRHVIAGRSPYVKCENWGGYSEDESPEWDRSETATVARARIRRLGL